MGMGMEPVHLCLHGDIIIFVRRSTIEVFLHKMHVHHLHLVIGPLRESKVKVTFSAYRSMGMVTLTRLDCTL